VKVRALDHFRVILDRKPRQWQTFYQQGRPLLCRREKKKIVQYSIDIHHGSTCCDSNASGRSDVAAPLSSAQ